VWPISLTSEGCAGGGAARQKMFLERVNLIAQSEGSKVGLIVRSL
jgi:hypothetical protein